MATLRIRFLALPGLALALASCVPPKAEVIADTAAPVKKETAVVEATVPEPELPPAPDEDIRMPPMLNLPTERDFRASNPLLPTVGSSGVTVRPPTDPPSRVKPGESATE